MKKLVLLLLFPLITFSQDYFYMGESSYETTRQGVLKAEVYNEDLTIRFVKNNDNTFIVAQTERVIKYLFTDKVVIYLENGDDLFSFEFDTLTL